MKRTGAPRLEILSLFLCVLACFATAPSRASAQGTPGTFDISGVTIEGNRRVDADALELQLRHTSGPVSSAMISEEVKRLYQTGFFDQVSASVVQEEGRSRIRYDVVEKPIVRKVFIRGNDAVKESELSEVFSLGTMRFLDKTRITSLMKSAKALYESRGYYDADFEYSVVPVGENQVDLTLTVDEGARYKIAKVRFEGLGRVDAGELRDVMQTKRYKWWSSWLFGTGRLNREMLETDKALMRQYFFDHGFIDVVISDPVIEKRDGKIEIVFSIEEGTQYRLGNIGVAGELLGKEARLLLAGVESEPGDVFSATQLREDAFRVSDVYTDIGYAYANVVPDTAVNRNTATVDITFQVDPGEPVTVRRINIRGNEKTYDRVIRRELRIDEQEPYSSSKIRRSQVLLERLGYFEEVSISSEPVEGTQDEVDLQVNVREGATGSFSAGAGFSSSDGALFNARLAENNIFGTGRRLIINADLGSERENFVFTVEDRRLFDTYVSGGIDLLRTEREFSDFDRRMKGGALTFGYPLEEWAGEWGQDIRASLRYEYLDIEIGDVDPEDAAPLVIASEGRTSASGITPQIERNTIDNPLNPTRGSRQSLSVELTGLGGTEEYFLVDARQQLYHPLLQSDYGDLVFSWRTRFGYGDTFDGDPFPLFRRFFPGGINSVRGFENRTLGPKDENGNEYGGSKQFINNLELIFPLINSAGLKGVTFYDVGEAFDDNESIDFGKLRQAYGFGIRWTSPLGPIRVEFGFPIDREEGEDSMVTLFSFGAPL